MDKVKIIKTSFTSPRSTRVVRTGEYPKTDFTKKELEYLEKIGAFKAVSSNTKESKSPKPAISLKSPKSVEAPQKKEESKTIKSSENNLESKE